MSFLHRIFRLGPGPRMPEPESMDSAPGVEAYVAAGAQRYLARLDGGAARRAAAHAPAAGWVLDIGCGPAGMPIAVAARRPGLRVVGVDLSLPMLRRAREEIRNHGLEARVRLVRASGAALPFRSGCFGLVMSNSLLHHLEDPDRTIREAGRVADPDAGFFLRDLRRPSRLCLRAHLALFGRHYRGEMRRLFEDSVRAAYTRQELRRLLTPLRGVRVRWRGLAHLEARRGAGE